MPSEIKIQFLRDIQFRLRQHSSKLRDSCVDENQGNEAIGPPLKLAYMTTRGFPLKSD